MTEHRVSAFDSLFCVCRMHKFPSNTLLSTKPYLLNFQICECFSYAEQVIHIANNLYCFTEIRVCFTPTVIKF